MTYLLWTELAAYAIGTLGGAMLFLEFFQMPGYVKYNDKHDRYRISTVDSDVDEYTNLGRAGALLLAMSFALLFLVTILD